MEVVNRGGDCGGEGREVVKVWVVVVMGNNSDGDDGRTTPWR